MPGLTTRGVPAATTAALCLLLAGCGGATTAGPVVAAPDEVTIEGVGTVPLDGARCETPATPGAAEPTDPGGEAGPGTPEVDVDVVVTAEGELDGEPLLVELSRAEAAGTVVEEARVTVGGRTAPTRGWEAVAATSSRSGEPLPVPMGGGDVTLTLTTSEAGAEASGAFAVLAEGELTDETAEVALAITCDGSVARSGDDQPGA